MRKKEKGLLFSKMATKKYRRNDGVIKSQFCSHNNNNNEADKYIM